MATDLRRTSRVVGMFRLAPLHRAFSRAGLTERPLPDTRPDLGRCSKGFVLRNVRVLNELASDGCACTLDCVIDFRVVSSEKDLPARDDVRSLYASAAERPPLNEPASSAELFASVYEASVKSERVIAVAGVHEGRLVAFAYGHPWLWEEQTYPWARELHDRLGDNASKLDGTYSLNLLARNPEERYRGLGRAVLTRWIRAIGESTCWLQTSDVDSPARRLYISLDFKAIGHGPEAPNGRPGLVLMRLAPDAKVSH